MAAEPPPLPADRPRAPTVRSRLVLELASELVGMEAWPYKQVRVDLRVQGPNEWSVGLFASDGPDAVAEVLGGRADLAILNPASAVGAALRRAGGAPDELAAIATVPSYDQLGFAVRRDVGLTSLEDLATVRPRLRLSLRGQRDHAVHLVTEDVLAAVGVALDDVERWGGELVYEDGLPHRGTRAETIAGGGVDAVCDEGIYNWVPLASDAGMAFLPLGEDALRRLEHQGYRRSMLRRDRFPELDADIATVDFSGFLLYVRADADDELVDALCTALLARRDRIPWQGGASLPLEDMVRDAVDAPLPIPLHPAAERRWRAHGVLPA